MVLDDPTARMGTHSLAACPRWVFCPDFQWAVVDVTLSKGGSLRGFARNRTEHELQLQTFDGKLHLLDAAAYTDVKQEPQSYMPKLAASPGQRSDLLAYLSSLSGIASGPIGHAAPVTEADIARIAHPKPGEWSTYNGSYSANRYSPLAQINAANVKQLQPQFLFSPGGAGLEGTPLVLDGHDVCDGRRPGLRHQCPHGGAAMVRHPRQRPCLRQGQERVAAGGAQSRRRGAGRPGVLYFRRCLSGLPQPPHRRR